MMRRRGEGSFAKEWPGRLAVRKESNRAQWGVNSHWPEPTHTTRHRWHVSRRRACHNIRLNRRAHKCRRHLSSHRSFLRVCLRIKLSQTSTPSSRLEVCNSLLLPEGKTSSRLSRSIGSSSTSRSVEEWPPTGRTGRRTSSTTALDVLASGGNY